MTVQTIVLTVQQTILLVITYACGVTSLVAFVHAAVTRPDAFTAVDAQSKTFWVALLGGSTLLIWLFGAAALSVWFLFLIGVVAMLVYVVDVRRRVDEILGRSWFRKTR
ncbi:DUF2516 family protein [Gordonia shandongensis]|uniref:DUF2516 family protein n=1 Tax=Gordonia shandongensis TaxID=376351 RepID=UPI00041CE932|nr:DUF2516 family protein [Gordonia shandongensis]